MNKNFGIEKENSNNRSPEGKKSKWKWLSISLAALILVLLLVGGGLFGVICSFTEKRAPFPALQAPGALEQARLMMKVVRLLRNVLEKGKPYPKEFTITFSPQEMQTVTKIASGFGIIEKEWGKLFFQAAYLPDKKLFHGKGILHINKPFLRERQAVIDMLFQLGLKDGQSSVKIVSLSISGHPVAGPYPKLEAHLQEAVTKALAKKRVHEFITALHIGEKGEVVIHLSTEKILSGPGKMLLYL